MREALAECPVADEAVLLVSEIAANAAVHSQSRRPAGCFTVRAEVHVGDYVWVEVQDQGGPWALPAARRDGLWHGLDLVNEVASEWGPDGGPHDGWVVWFRLDWPGQNTVAGGRCA